MTAEPEPFNMGEFQSEYAAVDRQRDEAAEKCQRCSHPASAHRNGGSCGTYIGHGKDCRCGHFRGNDRREGSR